MAVEKVKQSTVRLSESARHRLKVLAGARRITMETAFDEAVELWLITSPLPQDTHEGGKLSRECARAIALCKRISKGKNKRPMDALLVILDGLSLLR